MPGISTFENVPLADSNEARWASILENCDPLLHTVAIVGISAVKSGVEQAQNNKAGQILAAGELVDAAGDLNPDLAREISTGSYPRPKHLELAVSGLRIVSAAVHASRLFRDHTVKEGDYKGQTGVAYTHRTVTASASGIPQSVALGESHGTWPIRNVQGRIFKQTHEPDEVPRRTEFLLAAAMYGTETSSTSVKLETTIAPSEQQASAVIAGGSREGDFIHSNPLTGFEDLVMYTGLIAELSPHNGRN
jgi:hypothetical protein